MVDDDEVEIDIDCENDDGTDPILLCWRRGEVLVDVRGESVTG